MRNLSRIMVSKKVSLIQRKEIMKTAIVILLVMIMEALVYGYFLGEECEQLKTENSELKQQLAYQKDKNKELEWVVTKMELVMAGKTAEEIFSSKKDVETPVEETPAEDDVIYID